MVEDPANTGYIHYFKPEILSISEQYAFGMSMPGRTYSVEEYGFGYCGKEKDNEIKGDGNSLDFGARIYDSRLARWLSIDPHSSKYSSISPYAYCANSPIVFKDPDGKDIVIYYGPENSVGYKYGSGLPIPDNDFLRKTIVTIVAISEHPDTKALIDEIANDPEYKFKINETPLVTEGSPNSIELIRQYTINYNPSFGLIEDATGQILSPFISFFHEFGHAMDYRAARKNATKGLTGNAAYNAEVNAGQAWAGIHHDKENNPIWYSIKEQTAIEQYENPLANYFNQLIRTSYVNGYSFSYQFYYPLDTKLNQNHSRTIGCGNIENAPTDNTPITKGNEINLK
jgi:RHS repeat-associated protein